MECDNPVNDSTKVNKVICIGTTIHKFKNIKVDYVYLLCIPYHPQTANVCLLSTKTYYQIHGGKIGVYVEIYKINLRKHN